MNLILLLNNDVHAAKFLDLVSGSLVENKIWVVLSQGVGKEQNLPKEIVEMKKKEYFNISKNCQFKCSSYPNINADEALEDIKEFQPQLMISVRFGQILQNPVIAIPTLGVVNLHSGILPKYRGIMASFWSILNGEKNLGCTLHYIENNGIDDGRIISFCSSEIDQKTSLFSNIQKLYEPGSQLVLDFLNKIKLKQEVKTQTQESLGLSAYYSYPKESDVKKFLELMSLS